MQQDHTLECDRSQRCYVRSIQSKMQKRRLSTAFAGLRHVFERKKNCCEHHQNTAPTSRLSSHICPSCMMEDLIIAEPHKVPLYPPSAGCRTHVPKQHPTRARAAFGPMQLYTGPEKVANEVCSSTPLTGEPMCESEGAGPAERQLK